MRQSVRNNILQILVASLLLGLSGSAWARTEVQVYSFSEVPAQQPVRLGLIAGPATNAKSDFEKIENLEIMSGRAAGDRLLMSRVEIARMLQEKMPEGHDVTFHIPNQLVVEAKNNLIPVSDVHQKVIQLITKSCASCSAKIRDLKVPTIKTTEIMTSWDIDASQVSLRGAVLLPLQVQFQNGSQKTFWAPVHIFLEQTGLVSRRALKMGDRLSAEDLEKKTVDITYQKESLVSESEAETQVLARYVPAGQALTAGDLKREPAAQRGQLVRVLAGGEDLEVSLQAVAEEAGAIGDMIKLKIPDSQKLISGKIIEKGVVRLQ
jgi:flagella basal body P-ring formation protein FlgA